MPRGIPNKPRSIISTDDIEIRTLPEIGDDDVELVASSSMSKAETEKFMNEKVVIEIEASNEPSAEVFVHSGNNGRAQYIKRGEPQSIKRKYLYSLLAAQKVGFGCAFGRDANGNEYNRLSASSSTTHRVRLIRDDNPQGGMKWIQQAMRETANVQHGAIL